ncbi:MAG: hypothetical protein AAGB51_12990 [Planctomycetota bacterium]
MATKPGLFRNLGAFVGHITKAVKTPIDPNRREVARTTQEADTTTPDGTPVTLHRTTIDEIERRDADTRP